MTGVRLLVAVGLLGVVVGCGGADRDEAVEVSISGAATASTVDTVTATVSLAPLPANGACGIPRRREHEPSLLAVTDAMGIFRRTRHSNDAAADHELRGVPADGIDSRFTRTPRGLGHRFTVMPTYTVKKTCEADPGEGQSRQGPSGACVIRSGGPEVTSRCFDMAAIREGRAAALADSGRVVGLVPDGIERVIVEIDGQRTETSVVENAYLARVPAGDEPTEARISLLRESLDGCEPSPALRQAAPALNRPPNPGGVPEIVRRSVRWDVDSRIAAKYARIWGGGDGITYWVVPHLRCEVASFDADMVCVTPVKDEYDQASSGCVEPGDTGMIHFPDGDLSAVAGFAPADAREAHVTVDERTVVLPIRERVFAGRLEGIPLKGEVGIARVKFR